MSKQRYYKYKKGDFVDIILYPGERKKTITSGEITSKMFIQGLAHYNVKALSKYGLYNILRKEQDIIRKSKKSNKLDN